MLPGALIFENGTTVLKRNLPTKPAFLGMTPFNADFIENRPVTPILGIFEGYQQALGRNTFSLWQIHS
jgi:hypothetical protein